MKSLFSLLLVLSVEQNHVLRELAPLVDVLHSYSTAHWCLKLTRKCWSSADFRWHCDGVRWATPGHSQGQTADISNHVSQCPGLLCQDIPSGWHRSRTVCWNGAVTCCQCVGECSSVLLLRHVSESGCFCYR